MRPKLGSRPFSRRLHTVGIAMMIAGICSGLVGCEDKAKDVGEDHVLRPSGATASDSGALGGLVGRGEPRASGERGHGQVGILCADRSTTRSSGRTGAALDLLDRRRHRRPTPTSGAS